MKLDDIADDDYLGELVNQDSQGKLKPGSFDDEQPDPAKADVTPVAVPAKVAKAPKDGTSVERNDDGTIKDPDEDENTNDENNDGDDSDEDVVVDYIKEQFSLEGDYELTKEGLVRAVNDASDAKANSLIDSYLDSINGLRDYHDFVKNGGSPEKFITLAHPDTDYSKLTADNGSDQKAILKAFYAKQGFNNDQITAKIERHELNSVLKEEAADALIVLVADQKKEKEAAIEAQKTKRTQEEAETQTYWDNFNKTLKEATSVKNLPISVDKKKQLVTYMTIPVKDNKSQYELDMEADKKDVEQHIALAYMRMIKYNFDGFIKGAATTARAKEGVLKFGGKEKKVGSGNQRGAASAVNPETLHTDLIRTYNGGN